MTQSIKGSIKEQIIAQLDRLTPEQQQLALAYTRGVSSNLPSVIPGETLVARAQAINFPAEDLAEIEQAIQDGCEGIDWDEW